MNRDEVQKIAIEQSKNYKCILLELATGFGKSKLALDIIASNCNNKAVRVLIAVSRRVHIDNWGKEIGKWRLLPAYSEIDIVCYNSLNKYNWRKYDYVILDEAHHLSEAKREELQKVTANFNIIALSATFTNEIKDWFDNHYKSICIKADLKDAISSEVLPQPEIILYPLNLDPSEREEIIKNPDQKKSIRISFEDRTKYQWRKDLKVIMECNQQEYYNHISEQIDFYKQKTLSGNAWAKNTWLKLCGDRLKWLARKKESFVKSLLTKMKSERVITFCADIKQTEVLGKNCINSKNKESIEILEKFNNKKLKHITTCNILNEGVNLSDCKVGILANINASERIVVQRIGRILRHKHPVLIIPYIVNTREEELVKKIVEGYEYRKEAQQTL